MPRLVDPKRVKWDRLKRTLCLAGGCAFMALNILSLLNPIGWINLPNIVRSIWNIVFGWLMICLQLGWMEKRISRLFGFLDLRWGRGLFYMFVGNNGLVQSENYMLVMLGWVVWGLCWFVGLVEIFGPRSTIDGGKGDPMSAREATSAAHPDGSLTINITPAQQAAAANFAANNASAVWSAAVAASGAGSSGGGPAGGSGDAAGAGAASGPAKAANPFFG